MKLIIAFIVGFQILDKKILHTLYAVPGRQSVKVVPHRVEVPVIGDLRECDVMVAARKRQIADVDDRLELRRVRIAPELIALRPLPRQRPRDLYAVRHIVEGEIAEVRVVGKYKVEVVHAVFEQARPRLIFEPFLPVIVPGVSEFRLRFGKALVGGKQLHVLLLHGEVTHGAEGSLVIVIAEPVDADDVKGIAYVIAMNYCTCADTLPGLKNNAGAYFEKLIGHLYARHLGINPSTQMNAVELDGESISLPTDFIFNLGPGKPKLHIPVKTSTRERVVEVWAQQRILDGAFGVGRFFCLLTCIGETNLGKNMSIDITCVPNQWMNYQLFVAQITRAYYLDMPEKYRELNDRFPKIHVKEFGEYFHESEHLFD